VVNALNASSFQNVTMGTFSFGGGFIDGLAPQEITYQGTNGSSVAVLGGSHGSTFTVQDTFPSSAFRSTEIDPGLGTNTINVLGTTGPLLISGQGGRDTVNVGGDPSSPGTLTHIRGGIFVDNSGGPLTKLQVNGRADNFNHIVTLQAAGTFEGSIFGLAQAAIQYDPSSISALHLFGGNGNDQFLVQSVPAVTGQIFIHGGSGNDFFNIGSPSNNLDNILSVVNVIGGVGGHNTLFVVDNLARLGHTYQRLPGEIVRSGDGGPLVIITFNNNLQNVQLFPNGSVGAPQAQDLALTEQVRVGQTATLTGQLVDDDPNQVLSLTVDWGDGSDPETSTPDRDPFAVTHTYARWGTYFVHVTWSDSDGLSNSRDMLIRVEPAYRHLDYYAAAPFEVDNFNGRDALFALLGAEEGNHDMN